MNWFLFQEIGFYVILLLTIYFTVRKQYVNLVALYFWGTAFACCYKFAITLWTPEKIISLAMIWCILFSKSKSRNKSITILMKIAAVLIAAVCYSDVIALLTPPKFQVGISPYQRIVLQNFAYLTNTLVLLFCMFLPRGFISELYPKYCSAVECGILGGSLHYLSIQFDIPFMPILRTGGVVNEMDSVLGEFGGEIMLRVYGFAGEPKGLGFLIVPYLIISAICLMKGKVRKGSLYHISFLLLGGFILFTTLSSSAFINFFLMIPAVLLLTNVRLVVDGKPQGIVFLLVFLFIFGIGMVAKEAINPLENTFWDNINERSFRRGQTELSEGRQETIIYDYYKKEDAVTRFCGWGIGQYTFHVPDQVNSEGQLIPVQSGILLTLTDFGYLGIALYLCVFLIVIRLTVKCRAVNSPLPLAFAMATLSKCVESFMHGSIVTCFMFLMIAYTAYKDSCKSN